MRVRSEENCVRLQQTRVVCTKSMLGAVLWPFDEREASTRNPAMTTDIPFYLYSHCSALASRRLRRHFIFVLMRIVHISNSCRATYRQRFKGITLCIYSSDFALKLICFDMFFFISLFISFPDV